VVLVRLWWLCAAGLALAGLTLSACESEDGGVPFEVVADEPEPAIHRAGLERRSPMMRGAELVVAGIARTSEQVRGLWQQIGFRDGTPTLAEGQALLVLAGGEPANCPWTVDELTTASGDVQVRLGTAADQADCGSWQPRALALSVPADELPADEPPETHDHEPVRVSPGEDLPLFVLPTEAVELDPDGPAWAKRLGQFPHELSADDGGRAPELAATGSVAVTSLPGFDVVHIRLDGEQRGRLSAEYVDEPPVPVEGDAVLRIELHRSAADPVAAVRRLEAPSSAAVTEMVRVPETDTPTWVVGIDGDKAALALWSRTYSSPELAGSSRLIGIHHSDA
jgi:hypothetical protein